MTMILENEKAAEAGTVAAQDSTRKIEDLNSNFTNFSSITQDSSKEISNENSCNTPPKLQHEIEIECYAEMSQNGLPFEGSLIADGKVHRYSCDTKQNKPDEWYVGFSGFSKKGTYYLNVVYGSWSTGEKHHFHSWKKNDPFFKSDAEDLSTKWQEQKNRIEKELLEEEDRKSLKAEKDYQAASNRPNSAVAYFEQKKISPLPSIRYGKWGFEKLPNGTWDCHDVLLFPLYNIEGVIRSIQRIRSDGEKRVYGPKRGCFFQVGEIKTSSRILVCEGLATGASVHEQTGDPLVVAVDCHNLGFVIKDLRKKYPSNPIFILGDDDVGFIDKRSGEIRNPGRTAATTAAREYDCLVAFPKFKHDRLLPNGKNPKDWNDLLVLEGVEELKQQISNIVSDRGAYEAPTFSLEELKKALDDNECGDADLFKKFCGKDFLFDPDEKAFYLWDGTAWSLDKNKIRNQNLQIIADCYSNQSEKIASTLDEKDKFQKKLCKDLLNRSIFLKTTRRMGSVLEMATVGAYGDGGITFNGKWDHCKGFLPCSNGLINLKNGSLIKSGREHFIRKHSLFNYEPNSTCPVFNEFILSVMGERKNLAEFLQRLIGYASTGNPIEHLFAFFYGPSGRNGKGTLLRTLSRVLGHVAKEFPSELLLLQRNPPSSGTPRPDLVHLQGTRIAVFSEINKGRTIDSAVLKNLSGGDTIAARSLFSNDLKNFSPSHTIFLQANHRPKAPADDIALWRRAVLIPFDVTYKEEPDPQLPNEKKIDPHLEERLEAEMPGILRWVVEGAVEYKKNGLLVPQEVRTAIDDYRNENDGIGAFLKERCDFFPELSTRCSVIREAIKKYCEVENFNVPTKNEITSYLLANGFTKDSRSDADYWRKISLKTES